MRDDRGPVALRAEQVRLQHGAYLLPAIFTPALSENFLSDGPKLRAFVKLAWRTPEYPDGITLDRWQCWLIDRILERYPLDHPDPEKAGRLRFREVVVSIPRQNGKSVLGAIFALYGLLMHEPGPIVIGVASSAEQALIVYNRVLFVVQGNPDLAKRFKKMTETRGITTRDGSGTYTVKASKGDALQGNPVSLPIVDELHITKPAVWQSLKKGTTTRRNGLLLGITTAGDDDSELLKFLYQRGAKSADLDPDQERYGFFCWQAPEAVVPDDDGDLAEAILLANPGAYEGRIEIGTMVSDARGEHEVDVIRYTLNRFTASKSSFIPTERWIQCLRDGAFPRGGSIVFAVDRTPDWGYATITAATKVGDVVHTEIVASIVRPTIEGLADTCTLLADFDPTNIIMDGYSLKDLGLELRRRGLPVFLATHGDTLTASTLFYSRVIRRTLKHSGDELLSRQIPHTIRKNVGDGFRISRKDSAVAIDAVISQALAVFAAETMPDTPVQVF